MSSLLHGTEGHLDETGSKIRIESDIYFFTVAGLRYCGSDGIYAFGPLAKARQSHCMPRTSD
jgi:hypothetical protein